MTKTRCPICDGRISEDGGYYLCERHGVMPYDWAVGNMAHAQALKMMANWGVIPKEKKSRRPAPVDDAPAAAPAKGVDALLVQLRNATNPVDKRRLRQALRKAGHVGGLKK
jgi:hypothetical protein